MTSFTVNLNDLTKILEQIKIAELHAAGGDLATIIGPDAALLPNGLRTVDGSYNHLLPGLELQGAADQIFPRMLPADFRLETDGDTYTVVRADVAGAPPGGVTITNNNYNPTIPGSHSVADADLRIISNLIVDATLNNPAALQAALYAAIVPAGTNDLNAAQGAKLTADKAAITALHGVFKTAAAAADVAQRTETAFETALTSAGSANAETSAVSTKLGDLLGGVAAGETVDTADTANLAAALAAANAAVTAQQAVLQTLQFEATLAPTNTNVSNSLAAAKVLLAELHAVAASVQAISAAFVDTVVDAADVLLIQAAIDIAGTASTHTAADRTALTGFEAIATTASNAADTTMAAAFGALNTELTNDGLEISGDGSLTIKNRSPDVGLSPGFNGWMTFFGQFFDHGLDLVTKGNNGTIYIPLQADDPLYDKGQDGLVGDQQVRDADGNLLFNTDGSARLHNDDGYGADGILGTVDDRPNFMALTRATTFTDPKTGLKTETQNTTTPFIDQNQTYTSSASHQVFLREYTKVDIATDTVAGPVAVATGRLLDGNTANGSLKGSIANWFEVKAQAVEMLGLKLTDFDVNDAPKLAVDPYGKFIPGAHGFAQVFINVSLENTTTHAIIPQGTVLMEGVVGGLDLGNLAALPQFASPPAGFAFVVTPVGTGHAFLNDISHHAAPGMFDSNGDGFKESKQTADLDIRDVNHDGKITQVDIDANDHDVNEDGVTDARDLIADDHVAGTYDNEMLDAHFITGDGRGNENIGLTTVHSIFHAEHNRLVEENKDTIIASGDVAAINQWLLATAPPTATNDFRNRITQADLDAINALTGTAKAAAIDALNWDGERLFQAGRFVTEMQYQHLVFEEFARKVQPNVNPFVFTNSPDLDPSIFAEFAHVVYRFGHSMLSDTVDRLDNNLSSINGDPQLGLIQAFLNPQAYTASGATNADAAGAIIRGMTRQVGGEMDEFVVQAVRDNLVGLPLDLPALNMARARDTGVPSFNHAREQFYAMTGNASLKPYTSWADFGHHIKNPISIINFIAAYGTHSLITGATTAADKRAVATLLVMGDGDPSNGTDTLIGTTTVTNADRLAFLNSTGTWTAENSGLNDVDLWIAGLAESKMEFGGMLGSTFNFVFEAQMENLQNGDRFYYLSRTQGMNLLNQLEPNTFSDLVMRNTSLGDLHSTHVNGTLFDTADAIIELDANVAQEGDTFDTLGNRVRHDVVWEDGLFHDVDKVERDNAATSVVETSNYLKFNGGEHVVLGGSEGNDTMYGDRGIDTLWGDGGDDYLNGGSEADQVFGGDGDDIIEDFFGDGDFLRGNKGNDVISTDRGVGDILFGDSGKDFIMAGTDVVEVFGGEGDDFILGSTGGDGLLGNEGDDWIEGGEGFDGLSGENSDLFFNSPIIGHDVLNGQGNDTDYDGESGDDIMFGNAGITRANGMLGFDWIIQKGDTDTSGAVINLGLSRFVNQQALTLRDRNDAVEGASGWKYNDTLIGTSAPTGAVGAVTGPVGGPVTDSQLLSQNVDLISGLGDLVRLTPGGLLGQSAVTAAFIAGGGAFSALAKDTTIFDPQNGGDILLGGAGSDVITGLAGNDIIDGDRWLNVKIEVHANKDGTGGLVTNLASVGSDGSVDSLNEIKADMLAGRINPGQLKIVRELITDGALATDDDVAVYAGNRSDYTITRNANGTVTVRDNNLAPSLDEFGLVVPLLADEGTDTLSKIEILRFTNRNADGTMILGINGRPTFTDVRVNSLGAGTAASGAPTILDANGGTPTQGQLLTASSLGITDLDGFIAANVAFQWQIAPVGTAANSPLWVNVVGATAAAFTPAATEVGQILRVVASFSDSLGNFETLTSTPTGGVGTSFTGRGRRDTVTLTAFDDIASGLGGADSIDGGAGNDTLNGGAGNDTLIGGTGIDTAVFASTSALATFAVNANGSITVTTAEGADNLTGIEKLQFTDRTMSLNVGTAVNDLLLSTVAPELFFGLAGNDTVSYVNSAVAVTANLTTGQSTVGDRYNSIENLTGSNLGDSLTGSAGNNILDGGDGNDTINGGGGNDTFFGSAGNDSLTGAAGNDLLDGGDGNDSLIGGNGLDTFIGGAGDDRLNGGANADTASYVNATSGVTVSLAVAGAQNTGAGTDTLVSIENLTGSAFADVLTGSAAATAANVLAGAGGADQIQLNNGNDNVRDVVQFFSADEFGDIVFNFDVTGAAAQVDHVRFTGALNTLFDNATNNDTFQFNAANAAGNNSDQNVNLGTIEALFLDGSANNGVANANLGSAAAIAAEFNAEFALTAANGEATLLVINDTNGNDFAVWQWVQAGGGEIVASELSLVGRFTANGAVGTGSFDFT
jgi:Ca2+-binding RTX toxin-like protein